MNSPDIRPPAAEAPPNGHRNTGSEVRGDDTANRLSLSDHQSSVSTSIPAHPAGDSLDTPSNPVRKAGIIVALLVLGGLIIGFLPHWRQRREAQADTDQLAIPTVSVVSPQRGKAAGGLVLPAEIRPWLEASIFARANGYLKNWIADIGAHVEAGQLLALIETPDLDQQLEQARAELVLAQANLHLAQSTDDRWQELLKTSSVSEQAAVEKAAARETAAASVEASRANVRRLEELVSFQRVVAPFAGTVTIRAVDVGDLVVAGSGGSQLFHLAQTDKLRVYVRVPEPDALGIAPGQEAALTTPESPGQEFAAKVVTTSEAISPASRTLLTELEVDNSKHQILPNSFGEVRFRLSSSDAPMTLPSAAVLFRAQGLQVAVVRPDDTIDLRKVQIGRDFGQDVEILSGVASTDRVVANPSDSLLAGIKVRIAKVQTATTN